MTYLEDDLNGEESDEVKTVLVGLGGKWVKIDLGKDNREDVEDFFGKLLDAGRPVKRQDAPKPTRALGGGGGARRDPEQTRAIRNWARNEGYEVSERGRIPSNIEAAYDEAHAA